MIYTVTSENGTIQLSGEPVITLMGWAEAVELDWPNAKLTYQYEEGWGINVPDPGLPGDADGMWIDCQISPPMAIPEVFRTYYGLDENGDEI